MKLPKRERLKKFIDKLSEETPARNEEEALELVSKTLNDIEDEYTTIPYDSESWMDDGRMYPPQMDARRKTENSKIVRYRNKGHNTYIGTNGSIRIEDIRKNQILLDKPGSDGKHIGDL